MSTISRMQHIIIYFINQQSIISFQPNYVPTLEDEIEMERQKKVEELKKRGKLTPITEESFKAWQDRKRKARAEEAKKMVEKEMKKKKGGKGLSVLSGRDLYEYKKSLFDAGDQEEDVDTSAMEDNDNEAETEGETPKETEQDLAEVVARVESNLFLEGDDDDLEDLDDLEDG